ncbi:MAG: replication factor C small subunit [Promethearchaeota archaeon]|nr:MAG: replication factor C small subunit [Candidatus Lokiarchaeota archaeon]
MTLNLDIPWVEKYRPKTFDDIVSQNVAISNLKEFVKSGNMPHMIFTGPAGTGKTSTALIIARTLLGGDDYFRNVLELNASDTVRMQYVRKILKEFVNQNMILDSKNLKIVILDEADNIPSQVQQALRRIIEKASTQVKFILLCNYINKIIDPIISRCAVFRFVRLPKDIVIKRLKFICKEENLNIASSKSEEFFNTIYFISRGDLRRAINILQSSVALEIIDNLDINEVLKISGFVDIDTLENLIKSLNEKNFEKSMKILQDIENIDSRNFIRQVSEILSDLNIKSKDEVHIHKVLGEIDYRISQGSDERIQIPVLISEIIQKITN